MANPKSPAWWAFVTVTISLPLACSRKGDGSPRTETTVDPAHSALPAKPAPPGARPPVLFAAGDVEVGAALEGELRRADAKADGWPSEVYHDQAKKALHGFLEAGLRNQPVDEFLAADFQGSTVLRPEGLKLVHDSGTSAVARAESLAPELQPPAALPQLLAALRAPFLDGPAADSFKIVRVDMESATAFTITALVQIAGKANGGPVQQNGEWRIAMAAKDESHVGVRSIRLHSFDEVRSSAALYGDVTAAVFGANPRFREELQRGVNEYFRKVDRLCGNLFMGWQGVAVGDVDGDGLDDLYVAMQGGLPNRLFRHNPDGTATDVAVAANVAFLDNTTGVLFADFDNDKDQDLALTFAQNVAIGWNDGSGKFPEFTRLEDAHPAFIHSLAAADPDRDGDLDLYACRYDKNETLGATPVPYHDARNGAPNLYWRNEGRRRFHNAAREVGLDHNNDRYSLAAIWEDFDGDGDSDLMVANDFGCNNYYRNDGGKFRDVAEQAGVDERAASMGLTVADYDEDGDMDVYVSNMFSSAGQRIVTQTDKFMGGNAGALEKHYLSHARGNTLLRNRGDGSFEDATLASGTVLGRWAWGAKFVDFNNDGREDLYVPNGFITNREPDDL